MGSRGGQRQTHPRARPTIRDVARLAGVAVSTVSAVTNRSAPVSAEVHGRVEAAIHALDYRPSEIGRSLRTGRSRVIGVVTSNIVSHFFPEMIRQIEAAARERGYSLIFCDSNEDPAQERHHLNILYGRRVEGALVACCDSSVSYDDFARRGFPIVFFERIPFGGRFTAVSIDQVAAARAAVQHFVELGHTRIACVLGTLKVSSNAGRREGFRQGMEEAGLSVRPEYLLAEVPGVAGGYRAGIELLSLPEPPTGVLCGSSPILMGLFRAAGEHGVRCPEQISLVGFDRTQWTENAIPQLTTIAHPARQLAREAVRLLVESKGARPGAGPGADVTVLQAELCLRGSTAPPSVILEPERAAAR